MRPAWCLFPLAFNAIRRVTHRATAGLPAHPARSGHDHAELIHAEYRRQPGAARFLPRNDCTRTHRQNPLLSKVQRGRDGNVNGPNGPCRRGTITVILTAIRVPIVACVFTSAAPRRPVDAAGLTRPTASSCTPDTRRIGYYTIPFDPRPTARSLRSRSHNPVSPSRSLRGANARRITHPQGFAPNDSGHRRGPAVLNALPATPITMAR